jgi:hypothetical protein
VGSARHACRDQDVHVRCHGDVGLGRGQSNRWIGEWQGRASEDKGIILQIVRERVLEFSYFSPWRDARVERGPVPALPRIEPGVARLPTRLREIAPLVTGTPSVTRTVKLGVKMSLRRGFDFVVNGERHHHGEPVNVGGELQVWDVVNTR